MFFPVTLKEPVGSTERECVKAQLPSAWYGNRRLSAQNASAGFETGGLVDEGGRRWLLSPVRLRPPRYQACLFLLETPVALGEMDC